MSETDSAGAASDTEADRRPERKVDLTEHEVDTLEFNSSTLRDELIIQLGARCGLRISETVAVRVGDFREQEIDGELRYFVQVAGKDTRADTDGKKEREAWVPADTWKATRRHINREDLSRDDYLIQSQKGGGLAPQSGRRVVKQVARSAYEATGKEKFLDVSSHDLRRFWASYLLVGKRVNPRVVMKLGGWERYESIEPYLRDPRPTTIADEMISAEWA